MKILMYLYYPFFDNHLAGGVQVWLRNLVDYIAKNYEDINIEIICPDAKEHSFPSDINVIHNLIDMERDFLEPSAIYQNLKKIKNLEREADIIWLIDRNFPIQSQKPKLLSLNTLCYEREAMALYQSNWDSLVVLSNFVKNQIVNYVDKPKNINIIPCYVDPIFLKKYNNKEKILKKYFPYNSQYKYILFPHRVDPNKGHITAINILEKLIAKDDSYRLLVPMLPQAKLVNIQKEKEYIEFLGKYIKELGLEKYIIFHEWVLYNDLPCYYSIGECTLFLSELPETFGITLLNSICMQTPVLSYGVGALNEVIPPGNGHINIKTEDDAVNHILKGCMRDNIAKDQEYVINNYVLRDIAAQYVQLFNEIIEKQDE